MPNDQRCMMGVFRGAWPDRCDRNGVVKGVFTTDDGRTFERWMCRQHAKKCEQNGGVADTRDFEIEPRFPYLEVGTWRRTDAE